MVSMSSHGFASVPASSAAIRDMFGVDGMVSPIIHLTMVCLCMPASLAKSVWLMLRMLSCRLSQCEKFMFIPLL